MKINIIFQLLFFHSSHQPKFFLFLKVLTIQRQIFDILGVLIIPIIANTTHLIISIIAIIATLKNIKKLILFVSKNEFNILSIWFKIRTSQKRERQKGYRIKLNCIYLYIVCIYRIVYIYISYVMFVRHQGLVKEVIEGD